MAEIVPSQKILKSKEEIKAYLGGISEYMFQKYRKLKIKGKPSGMPMNLIDGQWMAHADHIDEWFKKITFCDSSQIDDEAEKGGQ